MDVVLVFFFLEGQERILAVLRKLAFYLSETVEEVNVHSQQTQQHLIYVRQIFYQLMVRNEIDGRNDQDSF